MKRQPHNTPRLDYHRIVVGYHGCDREVCDAVLGGNKHLKPSDNKWDWLGKGVYFWEYGPERALAFASEQKKRKKLKNPAILGAYIHLGRCFDLTDISHTAQLSEFYPLWKDFLEAAGEPIPENKPGNGGGSDILLRNRDCALINWYMRYLDSHAEHDYYYQTIRGVFVEGEPAFEGSGIYTKTHVQLSVRDPQCILGYFLPTYFFGNGD